MFWPFKKCNCADMAIEVERLRMDAGDDNERLLGAIQRAGEAEQSLAAIQAASDDDGLTKIALQAASEIANIYARGSQSVKNRDLAVSVVIFQTVRMATSGKRHWNAGGVVQKAEAG